MDSLKRRQILRAQAKARALEVRKRQAASRTGQMVRSTVDVGDVAVPLDEMLLGSVETAEQAADLDEAVYVLDQDQAESVDHFLDGNGIDVEDVLDASDLEGEFVLNDVDRWEENADNADEAHATAMETIAGNIEVTKALEVAEQAAEEALHAKQTADGRNRIYAQAINPVASPEFPFVNGDLWYRTEFVGGKTRFVEVFMWNGSTWAAYQMVASSLLVPGSVGPVLIENGAVTGQKLAFDAIDGKTITGALMRTAATGQRLELGTDGLIAYNPAGDIVAGLTSAGGSMSLTGNLQISDPASTTWWNGGSSVSPTGFSARDWRTGNDVMVTTLNGFWHFVEQTDTKPARSGRVEADHMFLTTYQRDGDAHVGEVLITTGFGGALELNALRGTSERRFALAPGQESGYTIHTGGAMSVVELRSDEVRFTAPVSFNSDTDWVNLQSYTTAGVTAVAKVKAGIINVKIQDSTVTVAANTYLTLATGLPNEFRPDVVASPAWGVVYKGGGSQRMGIVRLTSSGNLAVLFSEAGSGVNINGSVASIQ